MLSGFLRIYHDVRELKYRALRTRNQTVFLAIVCFTFRLFSFFWNLSKRLRVLSPKGIYRLSAGK